MILAYARVVASRPAGGTVSGVSASEWKNISDCMSWSAGASLWIGPISPAADVSGWANVATPNVSNALTAAAARRGPPPTYHHIAVAVLAGRMVGPSR